MGDVKGIFERVYTFYIQVGIFQIAHKLYVSVPPSLYYFYHGESHSIFNINDYGKFVTPETVRPIAECIREVVGGNNESFVNAVLTLIQQMTYTVSDIKYPVETIVDGFGDCDVFSLLAASIIKAGGLDVVLFYYKDLNPPHMNLGVHLNSNPSHTWWTKPTYFEYLGKRYWVAECTPQKRWKVGEQLEIVANIEPLIIPLKYEGKSPAMVSASLDKPLKNSSISASVFIKRLNNKSFFTISGSISPGLARQPVKIYISKDEKSWRFLGETFTDDFGNYSFNLAANLIGLNYFKTSWSGSLGYAGSDSTTITLLVGGKRSNPAPPEYLDIPENPILRAYLATIYKLFQRLNRSVETRFFKLLDSESLSMISGEFAVLKKGDLNYTFGFILSGANANYSINVQGMDGEDVFQIVRQTVETEIVLVKVPVNLKENSWYEIEVNVSDEYLTARLYEGDRFLKGIGVKWQNSSITKFGAFMKCNNSALALKNLKAETTNDKIQASGNIDLSRGTNLWLLYILVLFVLVIIPLTLILKSKRTLWFSKL
ncbi:MAG: hypothetical protein QXU45_09395 [Candidatus Bathyarchaeia archaeon]